MTRYCMDGFRLAAADMDHHLAVLATAASALRRTEDLVSLSVGAHSVALERVIALAPDPRLLEEDPALAEVLAVHRPCPPEEQLLEHWEDRVEHGFSAIEQTGVPGLGEAALGVVVAVSSIYGSALSRALELLDGAGHSAAVSDALADDVIRGALVLHGLDPEDAATRARRVVEELDAVVTGAGPRIEFSGVDADGTVRLRAVGEPARDRWRAAAAVERAVREAVPDAREVTTDGVGEDVSDRVPEVFIPLSSLRVRRRAEPTRWIGSPHLDALRPGEAIRFVGGELALVACRVDDDLYVALDPFDRAVSPQGEGSPQHRGGAMDLGRIHLRPGVDGPPSVETADGSVFVFDDPLPVQRDDTRVEVAVP